MVRVSEKPNVAFEPSRPRMQTPSAVERIANFTTAARTERLTAEVLRLFKRNILDSIGCAFAALSGRPFHTLREQFRPVGRP